MKKAQRIKQLKRWIKRVGRIPYYRSFNVQEKKLGRIAENFLSKSSADFDKGFRDWAVTNGFRKPRFKRQHSAQERMEEVLNFMSEHKRSPSPIGGRLERRLVSTISNYTSKWAGRRRSISFLNAIRALDKCYKTGIPIAFRRSINEALGEQKLEREAI